MVRVSLDRLSLNLLPSSRPKQKMMSVIWVTSTESRPDAGSEYYERTLMGFFGVWLKAGKDRMQSTAAVINLVIWFFIMMVWITGVSGGFTSY